MRLSLRKRKRGQSWEDEAFDEREKWENRAVWKSYGERWKSREKTCCCKVRMQSLIHIGKRLHNISLSYNAEIISVVCASLASEQKVAMGLKVFYHIHCETDMVPSIDSKKYISRPLNIWIHLTSVLVLEVQIGETGARCHKDKGCISVTIRSKFQIHKCIN